ncbi:hypothetical protein CAEBREN_07209 [Caenorhabditis brenneri]|uniref:Uncharacterized protein n=1 Tax=Caenorhabditis brenneri TaxID=135651 RepID=G0N4I4_CAEBE|nr:hypothetical protein CAEBREN_07209 [Caenorhabditis brenneri]
MQANKENSGRVEQVAGSDVTQKIGNGKGVPKKSNSAMTPNSASLKRTIARSEDYSPSGKKSKVEDVKLNVGGVQKRVQGVTTKPCHALPMHAEVMPKNTLPASSAVQKKVEEKEATTMPNRAVSVHAAVMPNNTLPAISSVPKKVEEKEVATNNLPKDALPVSSAAPKKVDEKGGW